ncbi:hypothetical protein L6164_001040 [Bauhinia variegata]|uniref:Uncharacterized protein n=1 Tax=Bauhinia variegata TaxID=167791 RepID=A0ACB9Q8B5_BAUVA|nr:hypothetical protein L6164_001040 [Bauhinia variegata]
MEEKFPGCGIKVKPHIESAMKRLRTIYAIVYDMLNQSGFGWNDETKMIIVDSDDSHPNAKDYRNAQILLLDKLALAFGKDRATGKSFGMWLNESSKLLGGVANRLGVAKDMFDDSRTLMNELKKMDLTEQECFAVAEKILLSPSITYVLGF